MITAFPAREDKSYLKGLLLNLLRKTYLSLVTILLIPD
jgi:hypothetical protein